MGVDRHIRITARRDRAPHCIPPTALSSFANSPHSTRCEQQSIPLCFVNRNSACTARRTDRSGCIAVLLPVATDQNDSESSRTRKKSAPLELVPRNLGNVRSNPYSTVTTHHDRDACHVSHDSHDGGCPLANHPVQSIPQANAIRIRLLSRPPVRTSMPLPSNRSCLAHSLARRSTYFGLVSFRPRQERRNRRFIIDLGSLVDTLSCRDVARPAPVGIA